MTGVAALAVTLAACGSSESTSTSSAAASSAATPSEAAASSAPAATDSASPAADPAAAGTPMEQTLAFIAEGTKLSSPARVAFLTACNSNPYCQAQTKGAEEAAAAFGMDMKLFDANFSPDAELKNVQDAIQQGFDGYVFIPVAEASGCASLKLLQETGKPIATANSPMCGDADYTEGTVGFVGMQTLSYFEQHVDNAFASCEGPCEVLAVGGFVGSDLFTRWESAIETGLAAHPNVTVVSNQPGNFDPGTALKVTQDALQANPDISVVISSWDDMTRGVEQGVTAAGKTPGTDVRIYSVGATIDGTKRVKDGTWTETTVLLPYEETYYSMAQLARKLETGQDTPGFTNLAEAPPVVDGPGSIFITADNADAFVPEY